MRECSSFILFMYISGFAKPLIEETVFSPLCILDSSTYMWDLKNNVNEQINQKQTQRYRDQINGYRRRGRRERGKIDEGD